MTVVVRRRPRPHKHCDTCVCAKLPETDRCARCDASLKDIKQHLTHWLVDALVKLYRAGGGPLHLDDERWALNNVQYTNVSKLQHWGFIHHPKGTKRGCWAITPAGESFVEGRIRVLVTVVTLRNVIIDRRGQLVGVNDVLPTFDFDEMLAERTPHTVDDIPRARRRRRPLGQ